MVDGADPNFEREKWEQERALREREIDLREKEFNRSRWLAPLVLAITAAAIAGGFNAWIAWDNAQRAISLDDRKQQLAVIVDALKMESWSDFRERISYLVDTGIIADEELVRRLTISEVLPNKLEASARREFGFAKVIDLCKIPEEDPREIELKEGFMNYLGGRIILSSHKMLYMSEEYADTICPFR